MKRHVTKNFVKAMFAVYAYLSMVQFPFVRRRNPDAGSVAPCCL